MAQFILWPRSSLDWMGLCSHIAFWEPPVRGKVLTIEQKRESSRKRSAKMYADARKRTQILARQHKANMEPEKWERRLQIIRKSNWKRRSDPILAQNDADARRKRYHTDPVYRQKQIDANRAYKDRQRNRG
ncbi:hypothetical protein CC79DRAFT_896434 [Sarocladium strictum]